MLTFENKQCKIRQRLFIQFCLSLSLSFKQFPWFFENLPNLQGLTKVGVSVCTYFWGQNHDMSVSSSNRWCPDAWRLLEVIYIYKLLMYQNTWQKKQLCDTFQSIWDVNLQHVHHDPRKHDDVEKFWCCVRFLCPHFWAQLPTQGYPLDDKAASYTIPHIWMLHTTRHRRARVKFHCLLKPKHYTQTFPQDGNKNQVIQTVFVTKLQRGFSLTEIWTISISPENGFTKTAVSTFF